LCEPLDAEYPIIGEREQIEHKTASLKPEAGILGDFVLYNHIIIFMVGSNNHKIT